jgi:sulfoxide reductase catalytic subunit YedY
MKKIQSHEITPEYVYFSRRHFLVGVGALVATALLPAACRSSNTPTSPGATVFCAGATASTTTDELGAKLTSCDDVINYNNFYEFSLGKEGIGDLAKDFKTSPWTVTVGGLVNKPRTYNMDEILSKFPRGADISAAASKPGRWSSLMGFSLSGY